MVTRRLLIAALFSLCIANTHGSAYADQDVPFGGTVVVTVTRAGNPVSGAFVALVGAGSNRYGGITGTAGTYTFSNVNPDTYTARASAPGTNVGTQANIVVADGGSANAAITVTASGTVFVGLGAYGSRTGSIRADGRSGIFYLSAEAIPSLYRTHDYGGTWAPVTISNDDRTNGIDGSQIVTLLTTSGYPGEVAGAARTRVWYSHNFGVSWSSIGLPELGPAGAAGAPPARLFWAHPAAANAPSRLFLVANNNTDIYYADPTSTAPAWTRMTDSYKAASGDKVWVASGESSIFAAVVPAAGSTVTIYRVGTIPGRSSDASRALTAAAPASTPSFVRLGGSVATGEIIGGSGGRAPNTVLVYSNTGTTITSPESRSGNGAATMTTYTDGNWVSTAATSFRNLVDDNVQAIATGFNIDNGISCHGNEFGNGSIAPSGTFGSVASCWVEQSGTTLIVRSVRNTHNQIDFAFDANYGNGNRVVFSGDGGDKGGIKSDRFDTALNRPNFPDWPLIATAGFADAPAATTGGTSINGLNAANVGDVVLQPESVQNMAVSMSGGGRIVGSTDAGDTWFTLDAELRGGWGIDWWGSTGSSQWIVAGHGDRAGGGNVLAGVKLATPSAFTSSTRMTRIEGSSGTNLGITGRSEVQAIAGLTGTDKVVVAIRENGPDGTTPVALLSLVTLTASGSTIAATATNLGVSFTAGTYANSLTYCPPTGSASSVADTLFAAVTTGQAGGATGSVLKITNPGGASPGSPTTLAGGTGADFRDVRVHCPTGTVYVGRRAAPGNTTSNGLLKATTSQGTLSALAEVTTLPSPPPRERIETLDISPSNVNRVVAVTEAGDVFASINGGTTWRVLNNTSTAGCDVTFTSCGRAFGGPPGDIELAPNTPLTNTGSDRPTACPRGLCGDEALLGSSAGVYATDLSQIGAPNAPPSFAVTANGLNITMTWGTPTTGAPVSEYLLEVALSSAFSPVIYGPVSLGAQTSASLTAPPGTTGTFYFRVSARNIEGTGPSSNIASVTLPGSGGPTPTAPGTPQVSVRGDNSVALTWTQPSTGTPSTYRLYVTNGGVTLPGTPVDVGPITSLVSPPLPFGAYTLRVSAVAGSSEGPQSGIASFTIGCSAAPVAPTSFSITKLGGVNVRLAWTAPAAGNNAASSYVVQAALDSGFSTLIFNQDVGGITTLDGTAAPGTYHVRVLARNACGTSAASNAASVTLP